MWPLCEVHLQAWRYDIAGVVSLLARQARVPVADLSVKKYRLAVLRARGCAMATA